jgi:hypothetical protein
LGNRELSAMDHRCKSFFALAQNFLVAGLAMVTVPLQPRAVSFSPVVWSAAPADLEVRRSTQNSAQTAALRRAAALLTRCVNRRQLAKADCAGRKWPQSLMLGRPRALTADLVRKSHHLGNEAEGHARE